MKYSQWIATAGLGAAVVVVAIGSPRAATVEEIAKLSGPDRAATLVAGARKEGSVMLYSGLAVGPAIRPMLDAFGKKYPDIKPEFWRGASAQIIQKYFAERRAGKVYVDVMESGGVAEPLEQAKAAVPFHSPEADVYPISYQSADGTWATTRLGYYGLAYNTKLISPQEVPKTYDDLLDPAWQGKMAWRVGADTGNLLFIYTIMESMGTAKGEAYLQKFAQQKVVSFKSSARALVDRTGQGEYAMSLNAAAHQPIISKEKGAPLDAQMLDPIPSTVNTIHLAQQAPHPHAAMLLIDFFLSREGQAVFRKGNYLPAHPDMDVPDAMIRITPKATKLKELVVRPDEFFAKRTRMQALYKKYFN